MTEADYLTILDWLARNTLAGKRGSTPAAAPAIFDRLGIDSAAWSQMVKNFGETGSFFHQAKTDAQIRQEQLDFNANKDWSSDR
jgi:hypothetical protein